LSWNRVSITFKK